MMKLMKNYTSFYKRCYSVGSNILLTQYLPERSLVRLSGKDASVYLQGLITNDMRHLESGALSMFAMFLNSKGRVLYDSIIYNTPIENTYFIECDSDAALSLKDHLLHFKVRKKVNVDLANEEFNIWVLAANDCTSNSKDIFDYKNILNVLKQMLPQLIITNDPRLISMGLRIIAPKNFNISVELEKITNYKVQQSNFYKWLRYKLGVGEGLHELPTEKCFPMEVNGDYLHGISFHKGCYVGQELTARTYHTGVIRKRLMPLIFSEELKINEFGLPIFPASQLTKAIGKLYGVEQTNGLALLRIEEALKAEELVTLNKKCTTHRPYWWPIEAPKTRIKIG